MKIDHIAIWTKNLVQMRDFYVKYFGMEYGEKYENPSKKFTSYFLSFSNAETRIELMHNPEIDKILQNKELIGLTHVAISVDSKKKVDLLTEELRADGYTIVGEPRTTGDGYYESVILDPEGNKIEITE